MLAFLSQFRGKPSQHRTTSAFLLILILFSLVTCQNKDYPSFQNYLKEYGKKYSQDEISSRKQIYQANLEYLRNADCQACGVNNFTDWTQEEMKKLKGGQQNEVHQNIGAQTLSASGLYLQSQLPSSYDWREYGAVTSIKQQGSCGSCWAFSSVAFFESDLIINQNYTNQIDLSEQFLLYCDNRSLGCDGGYLFWAMEKVIQVGGLPNETQYQYDYIFSPQKGMCFQEDLVEIDQNRKVVSYFNIEDQNFIKKLILKKPVNVNLCSPDMQYYAPKSDKAPDRTLKCRADFTKKDHTVLLIGYTETQWIIKNQWGKRWGIGGYGYISRNSANDCCIGKELITTGTVTEDCKVSNCELCVEETSCFRCKDGYYVSNQNGNHVCLKCNMANCRECINFYGLCNYCNQGYSVSFPTYQCSPATVKHCTFMYAGQCNECAEGYSLTDKFQCAKQQLVGSCKIENCAQCNHTSQTNKCSQCAQGFELNKSGDGCVKFVECNVEDCVQCQENDSYKCFQCIGGKTTTHDNSSCVTPCQVSNCISCQTGNPQICQQCIQNYQTNPDNSSCIIPCLVQNCLQCTLGNSSQCSQCQQKFQTNSQNSKCVPKCEVQNCGRCVIGNSSQCQQCQQEFQLSQGNCLKPKCQISNCLTCTADLGKCQQCQNGYILSAKQTQCIVQQSSCHVQHCLNCSSQTSYECNQCQTDYSLTSTKTQCIPECNIYFCLSCQAPQQCSKCVYGYVPSTDKSSCELNKQCVQNIKGCESCENQNSCLWCKQGWGIRWVGQDQHYNSLFTCKVTSCKVANCVQCSEPGICGKCNSGFYLNDGICEQGRNGLEQNSGNSYNQTDNTNQTQNQNATQNQTNSTQDQIGTNHTVQQPTLDNFTVQSTTEHSSTGVITVVAVYQPENIQKQFKYRCPLGCKQCEIANKHIVCSECREGFVYIQKEKICQRCAQNCEVCSTNGNCEKCFLGYRLNNDSVCQACQIQNCLECSERTNKCITCAEGYYSNFQKTSCQDCKIPNCVQCEQTNLFDLKKCNRCQVGYTINILGAGCLKCLDGCDTCSYDALTTCEQCSRGSFKNSNTGKCQQCSYPCLQCLSSQQCSQCIAGYYLDHQTNKCQKQCFVKNCYKCQETSAQKCQVCLSGYLLNEEGLCQEEDPDFVCLQENKEQSILCLQCPANFYLVDYENPVNNTCQKCQISIPQCIICDQTNHCKQCAAQYYLSDNENKCLKCSQKLPNCQYCLNQNICRVCRPGFYLLRHPSTGQLSGKCVKCDQNCKQCAFHSEYCLSCVKGYQLTGSRHCFKTINIDFDFVIDADFKEDVNDVITDIYDGIVDFLGLKSRDQVQINSVQEGSIKVHGRINVPGGKEQNPDEFLKKAQRGLSQGRNIKGRQIISSQMSLKFSGAQQNEEMLSERVKIGIGVGIFVILFIVLGIYCLGKRIMEKKKQLAEVNYDPSYNDFGQERKIEEDRREVSPQLTDKL